MKKILIFIVILFVITACGSGGANTETVNVNIEATQAAEAIQYTREAEAVLYTREAEAALYTREAEANSEAVVEVVTTTPTNTPLGPTNTPTPIPPTNTPTSVPPTPTPTQDPRLFWDDFENGVKPEWGFVGSAFFGVNGKLVIEGATEGFVGDTSWQDYVIHLKGLSDARIRPESLEFLIRVQDRDNYMMVKCYGRKNFGAKCDWHKVVQGEPIKIPDTTTNWVSDWLRFEVEGNVYRTIVDNEQTVYFVDNTFSSGGFGLRFSGEYFELADVEISPLP